MKPKRKIKLELASVKSEQREDVLVIGDKKPKKADADSPIELIKPEEFMLIRDKKDKIVGIDADTKLIHLHKNDDEIDKKLFELVI